MSNGYLGHESSQCRAQCARRVALNDQQVRRIAEKREQGLSDLANVRVRILLAGAAQTHDVEIAERELARVEVRMLAGQHKGWPAASRDQASCNRGHFDCFRSGANDQPDIERTQYSP